jgi:pimeloyl-ACP methyl ester carboxylesterase
LRVPAECGEIEVFEDRTSKSGRTIELNLAIIPAISRNPAPDPLFLLAGGPGEAATESFLLVYAALQQINQKRAIVLVDQRGTGESNPISCADDGDMENELLDDAEIKSYLAECLADLDADPAYYTTPIAMDDLDEVRETLGYQQINLYGVSYGTRAAMVYARRHGEHLRSMILDGVVPLDWTLGPSTAGDAQRALDLLFDRCGSDPNCHSTFPNLSEEFNTVIERLQSNTVSMTVRHPTRGDDIEFTLNLDLFANTIHQMSYEPESAALIPLMVHRAFNGDFSPLVSQYLTSVELLDAQISTGMRLSVLCSEDVPFYYLEDSSDGYMGNLYIDAFEPLCEIWPEGRLPPDYKHPLQSDIPSLLLSGEVDPVTPPSNGDRAAETLTNSLHLVAPGQGHAVIFRGCIPTVANDFIESASVSSLDTACVEDMVPMPFFVNFSGPSP